MSTTRKFPNMLNEKRGAKTPLKEKSMAEQKPQTPAPAAPTPKQAPKKPAAPAPEKPKTLDDLHKIRKKKYGA